MKNKSIERLEKIDILMHVEPWSSNLPLPLKDYITRVSHAKTTPVF